MVRSLRRVGRAPRPVQDTDRASGEVSLGWRTGAHWGEGRCSQLGLLTRGSCPVLPRVLTPGPQAGVPEPGPRVATLPRPRRPHPPSVRHRPPASFPDVATSRSAPHWQPWQRCGAGTHPPAASAQGAPASAGPPCARARAAAGRAPVVSARAQGQAGSPSFWPAAAARPLFRLRGPGLGRFPGTGCRGSGGQACPPAEAGSPARPLDEVRVS